MTPLATISIRYDIARLSPNARIHWGERAKRTSAVHFVCLEAWGQAGCPVAPGPVNIRVTLFRSRVMDEDNAVACLKAVIDGLFRNRITPDDSPKWVHLLGIEQAPEKSHKTSPTTVVEVFERGER